MEDIYSISDMVAEALRSGAERYVAVGSVSAALDQDKTEHFCISADGKTLYYLDEIPEDKNYGELYQVSISSSGELGTPELYDSDVCTDNIYFIGENKLLYFKDYKNDKGELYINQEQVDYDVNAYSIRYNENTDSIIYFIDWSSEKNYGTLKTYTKKDAQKNRRRRIYLQCASKRKRALSLRLQSEILSRRFISLEQKRCRKA